MPGEVPSDVPPPAFGRFRVLHQIGAGSLGPVFRGEAPDTQEPVAIKYLRLNRAPDEAARITDALRTLVDSVPRHPSLARVIEVGQHEIDPYVVSSLATGESLDVTLREYGPAAIGDLLPRLRSLAEGLDLAAVHGVWHGALQPRDILVSAQQTEIAGIGIAPILERAGVRLPMRRPYAAPEVIDGGPTTARADQYALAAVTYEWLFGGRAPRSAESVLDAPALPDVDAEKLAGALMRALAPIAADRFPNCKQFAEAIGESVGAAADDSQVVATPAATTPTAVPLPLDRDEPELVLPAFREERFDEITPPKPRADLESNSPSIPKDSKRPIAWQGSLTAGAAPVTSTRRGFGAGALIAALIGGLAIGGVVGYVMGTQRATAIDSASARRQGDASVGETLPAQPQGREGEPTRPSREFTDAPVAAIPSAEPVARTASPPPIAPARDTARLLVRSSPPGASVAVDGSARGTTPLTLRELELGTRTLVISLPGYVPVERRIALTADRPSRMVEVQLDPVPTPNRTSRPARAEAVPSSLVVDSRPAGASVTIDGNASGVTPLTLATIAPGTHTVRIELPGYRPWTHTIAIKAGERARVAASLEGGQEQE